MKNLLALITIGMLSHQVFGQLSVTALDTDFTIDFESTVSGVNNGTFTAAGFTASPTAGQLDSDGFIVTDFSDGDVTFGGSGLGGDHTRGSSSGGVSTAGIYAFDIGSGDIILGVQPNSSDFNNGSIVLAINNNTGGTVNTINVAYNVSIFNDQGRSSTLDFSYSSDNITFFTLNSLIATTTEVADGSPAWSTEGRTISITGLNISNGTTYYLAWEGGEVGGSGSRDEFGIDDIVVSLSSGNLDILITEIMYNPNSADADWEWIEIYNNSSSAIDLSNFILDDDDATALGSSNITSGILQAGGAVIIMDEISTSQSNFSDAWGAGISYATLGSNWPGLGNSGDRIGLWANASEYDSRNFANAIDDVTYEDGTSSWPSENGSASIYYNDGTFAADNNAGGNWTLSTVSTATPVGTGFQSSVNGTTNTGADIASPSGDLALPVILSSFKSRIEANNIILIWETLSEINNDRFEVQRSLDGVNFSNIGTVDGHGNSSERIAYQYTDTNTNTHGSYYRLKQVDFDGQFEFSFIIGPLTTTLSHPTLSVFPNPVQDVLTLRASFTSEESIYISIFNLAGEIVQTQKVMHSSGSEILIELPQSLRYGIYSIKVVQGAKVMRSKFFKQG